MTKLENMSIEQLLAMAKQTRQKTKFQPKKFETDATGTIIIDKNLKDAEWLDEKEDGLI